MGDFLISEYFLYFALKIQGKVIAFILANLPWQFLEGTLNVLSLAENDARTYQYWVDTQGFRNGPLSPVGLGCEFSLSMQLD